MTIFNHCLLKAPSSIIILAQVDITNVTVSTTSVSSCYLCFVLSLFRSLSLPFLLGVLFTFCIFKRLKVKYFICLRLWYCFSWPHQRKLITMLKNRILNTGWMLMFSVFSTALPYSIFTFNKKSCLIFYARYLVSCNFWIDKEIVLNTILHIYKYSMTF